VIGMIAYAMWCAFCWRLRGGMISQITLQRFGYALSTGETRMACAFLMALPFAIFNPRLLSVAPAAFAAMTLGYFDKSMGLEEPGRDHAFLALWGVAVAAIMLVPIAALHHDPLRLAPAALGALVSAAYAASKAIGGRWTDRAEWFAGAIFGTAISLAAYG
jgi:hypothetical protein